LLLVDLIEGFTDPDCPLGLEADAVVAANAHLLEAARARDLPVAYSLVVYDRPDQAAVFRARVTALEFLRRGSPWTRIDRRLTPRVGEHLVEKHHASAFFGTGLDGWLRASAADSLIVTGLTTSGCVRATVVDGLQHGHRVFVPAEAVGDRNPDAHRANLHDMHAKYADVVPLDMALAMLRESA
jgi:nicotinamidase-related amidase